jgi:hypothetical protein
MAIVDSPEIPETGHKKTATPDPGMAVFFT